MEASAPPPAAALKYRKHLLVVVGLSWVMLIAQTIALFIYRDMNFRQESLFINALLLLFGSYGVHKMRIMIIMWWGFVSFMTGCWGTIATMEEYFHSVEVRQPRNWTLENVRQAMFIYKSLFVVYCFVTIVASYFVFCVIRGYWATLRSVEQSQRNALERIGAGYGALNPNYTPQQPEQPTFEPFQGSGRTLNDD